MSTAVSGSLKHIVWLQRFDGHTETNDVVHQNLPSHPRPTMRGANQSVFRPSRLSLFICAVISSWLFILDSLLFLGVEAWSMSSALQVRRPRLITVRLGVFSLRSQGKKMYVIPAMQILAKMKQLINTSLTVGQTGGSSLIVDSLVSILFTWISPQQTLSSRWEESAVICKSTLFADQKFEINNYLISPFHSRHFG